MLLNVTTIQIVVWAYYLSLVVVWTCVARSYPDFRAARWWQIATVLAMIGTLIGAFRSLLPHVLPVVVGNSIVMVSMCCLWTGIRSFYGRSVPWLTSIVLCTSICALLTLDLALNDSLANRLTLLAVGQCVIFAGCIRDLMIGRGGRRTPGAALLASIAGLLIVIHLARGFAALLGIGGPLEFVQFNAVQAGLLLALVVGGMIGHFGLVLMAVDRIRQDMAALAHIDDLTGIANRRQFLVRLSDACADAEHSGLPFTLMVIDLDGFKTINDTYGHSAGDECLRAFTRASAARLRDQDLIARTGGDEFCVILPAATLTTSALVARGLIKSSRQISVFWNGQSIPISASIGIAEWSPQIGRDTQRLIQAADQALYVAKQQGRDRLAVHDRRQDLLRLRA